MDVDRGNARKRQSSREGPRELVYDIRSKTTDVIPSGSPMDT
jgi:hypothetical protein